MNPVEGYIMRIPLISLYILYFTNFSLALTLNLEKAFLPSQFQPHNPVAAFWLTNESFLTVNKNSVPSVWNKSDGTLRFSFDGLTDSITAADLSKDRQQLAVSEENGRITVWDTKKGGFVTSVSTSVSDIQSLTFSYMHIVIVDKSSNVHIFQVPSGEKVVSLTPSLERVSTAYYLTDGRLLIGTISKIALGDPSANALQVTAETNKRSFGIFDLSHDETLLVKDQALALFTYDIQNNSSSFTRTGGASLIEAVRLTPKASHIVSGYRDGTIGIWSTQPLLEKSIIPAHQTPVVSINFSTDGKQMISMDAGGHVKLWSVKQASIAKNWLLYP